LLAGKLKGMGGKALLAPMMLICAKTVSLLVFWSACAGSPSIDIPSFQVLFPILITLFLSALNAGGMVTVDGVEYNMTLFGFLIGMCPCFTSKLPKTSTALK
jgi:hypothetical protein